MSACTCQTLFSLSSCVFGVDSGGNETGEHGASDKGVVAMDITGRLSATTMCAPAFDKAVVYASS